MLIAERQSRLQEMIAQRGTSDLDTLALQLAVSQSTVRRDIEALEQRGLVRRTHGGVIWIGDKSDGGSHPYAFDPQLAYEADKKRRIALAARRLVAETDTIFLDGGTTTYYLARELLGMQLQLVTNSLPIANLFLNDEKVELILVGGLLYPRYGVLLGPTAEKVLANIHSRKLFFSVAGLYGGNLYNQNLLLVQSQLKLLQNAQSIILLIDSGKFGQQALSLLCPLSAIHIVVTDYDIPDAWADHIRNAGCELIIAK